MAEIADRRQFPIHPVLAWTALTEAPLKGLMLAREAGTILAWDQRDQVTLPDLRGRPRSVTRVPGRIVAGAIGGDGSLIAPLGEGSRPWLLGPDLKTTAERQGPPDSSTLAIDPHGCNVAVASQGSPSQFYSRQGLRWGKLRSMRLCFC